MLFFLDPFDLNHNLGAGVSRKSKCLALDTKNILLMHSVEFENLSLVVIKFPKTSVKLWCNFGG